MARNPLARLSGFTAAQYGTVTNGQAASVAVTAKDLHRLRRLGLLVAVHRGVSRVTTAGETREGRAMAAVLAAGEGAVLSHTWAAWLHGLDRLPPTGQPEVTKPGRAGSRIPGLTIRTTRTLDRCDVVRVRGIPVTSGARTAVDLAGGRLSETEVMAVCDDLICRKATTRPWLHRRAAHLAGVPGWR